MLQFVFSVIWNTVSHIILGITIASKDSARVNNDAVILLLCWVIRQENMTHTIWINTFACSSLRSTIQCNKSYSFHINLRYQYGFWNERINLTSHLRVRAYILQEENSSEGYMHENMKYSLVFHSFDEYEN